ncbi:MAG: phage tail tape measure protein, partial [Oscillospiraceae bacterium]|nr:phage tail tape measure protein [Oscillospiraceae bacterium]
MASKRIKGFTIEINGNTTGLSKALNKVDKNIKNTQSALKDVEKLLKLDPTNTELLAQKQRLLGEAISDTESRLETLKAASEKAAATKDNYDAWKEKYDPIQEQISKTSEELKKLKEQDEKAKEQLSKGEITQEQYNSIQKNVGETSDKLKALKQSAQDVSAEFGNPISSSQYDALQREIIETQQELQNLQREADNSKEALVNMSETGEKMQSVGDKISGVGESLMPVTNGIVSIGKAVVQTGAEFDAEMSKVEAIAGTVADEDLLDLIKAAKEMGLSFEEGADSTETAMNIIRAKAREMGSQTKYSASEAGEAFEYMAMAGWKPYDMLYGIEGVLNLAAASGEELGTTSDIVTDALTALGMGADDAGHFSDVLAAASSNANTNVSMLGESFKYVAPIAGALGANAEDLALALGLMANSGIKGSQAGNALKNGLTNLTGVSKKYTKEMENLGLMTTETVNTIDQAEIDKAMSKVADKTADLEKKQIAYNTALETYSSDSPKVQNAMGNVETAQINLNDAISKYGEDSSQAQKAAIKLEQAQNNLNSVMSQCGEDSPQVQKALIDLETAERHLEEAQNDLATAQQGTWETVGTGKSLLVDEYGNMKSLGEIMDILREKMGGVDVAITDAEGNLRSYDDIIADLEQSEEGLTQA